MSKLVKSIGSVVSPLAMLFGASKTAAPPVAAAPAVMPTPDDEAVRLAKRRQIAQMQAMGGRASTILSDDNKLGG